MVTTKAEKTAPAAGPADMDGRQRRGDKTRQALLGAAFETIYLSGFRAASLNDIIAKAGCTKGSLYHHFPDKHALGLAAVADFIGTHIRETWIEPLSRTRDPLSTIRTIIEHYALDQSGVDPRLGCPFQNISLEMSAIDKQFKTYFKTLFEAWRDALTGALKRGQENGTVRAGVDAQSTAVMIITTHQGTVSMIKATQDRTVGHATATAFFNYLESLRP